jgi:hypothetical protein
MWGGLEEASLIIVIFFSSFFTFIFMSLSRRRGIKQRSVRGRCTGHATIAKVEAAKASISIPLLHWSLIVKVSNPFFKGLNLWAFFTLGCNQRTRGLQVQVSAYFFHRLGDFPSLAPLMLSPHICGMLGLTHPKH